MVKWLKWCPYGCGKHVRFYREYSKTADGKRSFGHYGCSACKRRIAGTKKELDGIYHRWSDQMRITLPQIANRQGADTAHGRRC